jgi:hypothetical protein
VIAVQNEQRGVYYRGRHIRRLCARYRYSGVIEPSRGKLFPDHLWPRFLIAAPIVLALS